MRRLVERERRFTTGHHITPSMLDAGMEGTYAIRVRSNGTWFTVASRISGLAAAASQALTWWQMPDAERIEVWDERKTMGEPWYGATIELEKHVKTEHVWEDHPDENDQGG